MGDVAVDYGTLNQVARQVNNIANQTNAVYNMMQSVDSSMKSMETAMTSVSAELRRLSEDFRASMLEQRKQAAYQEAITELGNIRADIDRKCNENRNIRKHMLGVLQASDFQLVKTQTISEVSEQLFLSNSEYWLAPCLVAVAAWMGNDRDLAERAIREAVKRDEEKTSITMALICRRNNRVDACYKWLARYFAKQNASSFSEGSFAYVDAYVNGIFGPDEKHMCDDYINRWMNEIRGNSSSFEAEQEEMWKHYCERYKGDVKDQYPLLSTNVAEFPQINEYLSRIQSVDPIANKFTSIANAYVDQETLKAKIDKNLITLIEKYEGEEAELRRKEHFWEKVKSFDGDKEKARLVCDAEERARREATVNLVEQMSHVIVSDDNSSPSQKKTAVSFLSGYIRKGFDNYITEKKNEFPKEITMNVDGWIGKTSDGNNLPQLMVDYENTMNIRRQNELKQVSTSTPTAFMIGAIISAVIGLIGLFAFLPVGILLLGVAGYLLVKMFKAKKSVELRTAEIQQRYNNSIATGKETIAEVAGQWVTAKEAAQTFDNTPIREIIA